MDGTGVGVSMAFQSMNPQIAGFDEPLLMLGSCHDRIRAQCEVLQNLAAHMQAHGCDGQAQQAASNVMRYFDSAGRHHHEDEELDLFPRMIAAATGQNAERVALLVEQLKHEHREMEKMWSGLSKTLELIAHGGSAALDALEVSRFCAVYRAHIALEDANMIPLASHLLGERELAAIGEAMAARRGIKL
jgi:hemerythrin-like domain-containing protein